MFWPNLNNNSIKQAHLNGSDITTIVKDGLKYPGMYTNGRYNY